MAKDNTNYKLMMTTPDLEVWRVNEYGSGKVMQHGRIAYNYRATLAQAFVERWGMVAAIPDGEDSAGRQKLRLATPAELAERAVAATTALFDAMDAAGWKLEMPSYSEFIADEPPNNH